MTSIEISKELNIQHFSIGRIIEKYSKELEFFGDLKFEITQYGTGKGTAGGRPTKLYFLNEKQRDFLIVLLKNTRESVKLKAEIIKRSWRESEWTNKKDIFTHLFIIINYFVFSYLWNSYVYSGCFFQGKRY